METTTENKIMSIRIAFDSRIGSRSVDYSLYSVMTLAIVNTNIKLVVLTTMTQPECSLFIFSLSKAKGLNQKQSISKTKTKHQQG